MLTILRPDTLEYRPAMEDIEIKKLQGKMAFIGGTVSFLGGMAMGILIGAMARGGKGIER